MENTASSPSSPPTSARDRDVLGRRAEAFLVDNLMVFALIAGGGVSGLYALVSEGADEFLGLFSGLFVILASENRQRLRGMAARTLVVRKR